MSTLTPPLITDHPLFHSHHFYHVYHFYHCHRCHRLDLSLLSSHVTSSITHVHHSQTEEHCLNNISHSHQSLPHTCSLVPSTDFTRFTTLTMLGARPLLGESSILTLSLTLTHHLSQHWNREQESQRQLPSANCPSRVAIINSSFVRLSTVFRTYRLFPFYHSYHSHRKHCCLMLR